VLPYMKTKTRAIKLNSFSGRSTSKVIALQLGLQVPDGAVMFSLRKGAYSLILPSTERTSHKIHANGLKRSCRNTGRLKSGGNLKANRVESTICFWNHVEWW